MTPEFTTTDDGTFREFVIPKPEVGLLKPCGDPVGALEVASRLGIQDRSIHMIRRRGQLPPPDYTKVNGSRAWEWSTILWWAGETDRLRSDELRAEYRTVFGSSPPDLSGGRTPPGVKVLVDDSPAPPAPTRKRVSSRR